MNEPTTSNRPEQGSPLPTRKKLLGSLLILAVTLFFTQSSLAAVAFRAATSASAASGGVSVITATSGAFAERTNCGSVTPAIPSGNVGDLLIAQVILRRNDTAVTMTGWNTLFSNNVAGAAYQVFLFWRSATGTDPNTVSQSGTCDHLMARITRFGNVDTAQPLETQPLSAGNWAYTNAGDVDTGTQNISVANSMLVLATFVADNRNVTQEGTFTQLYDNDDSSGADAGFSLNYRTDATTGNKGPFLNMDLSGNGSTPNHGVLFAVRPAANANGLTINKPAGTITGDVMVASIAVTPDTVGITPPSGWTIVQNTVQTDDAGSHLITYYKIATGSEPANYSWSFSVSHTGAVGGIATFSGVDTTSPIVSSASRAENGNTAVDHTAPSITASTDDMLITVHEYQSSGTWTPPNGMAKAVDKYSAATTGANGVSLGMNYLLLSSTGATGTKVATASNNGDEGASHSLALKAIPLTCFTDNFNRADGAPAGNWVVANESGTFGNPTIVSQRLRLTDASTGVSTMAALQQLFPATGNKIIVEFDHLSYNGSGGDGMCVVLSNAAIAPVPGAFGGSLGYAPKQVSAGGDTTHAGFAGGWLGIALDEYGNFSNPTEGRTGGPGFRPDSASIRGSGSLYTGYNYLTGTTTLAPGIDNAGSINPAPGYRYRITIDHTDGVHAYTSVERDTGTGYTTLIPSFDAKAAAGQAAVPTNWLLSFTGSTGASANFHEFDNLRVCSTQPQPLPPHHVRILHDGQALSCAPETITLQACANASCTPPLYQDTVTLDLNEVGIWSADPITFSGGQTTVTLVASGSVTLGGKTTFPTPTTATCYNTSTGTNDCTLNFAPSSLAFDVPDHSSATRQLVTMTACTSTFASTTRSVKFWSTYNNPSSGTKKGLLVKGIGNDDCATGYSALGTSETGATTLNLDFGSGAFPQATFSLCYPDVGEVRLDAKYEGAGTNIPPDPGVVVLGNDTFIAKPYSFLLSGIKQTAMPQLDNPAAADANGAKFIKAGEAFSATVTARNYKNETTPNYGKESIPEWVKLTSSLASGLDLTNNPEVGRATTGSINSTSTTLTVASSAGFLTGDRICVKGAGVAGGDLVTTITAIPSTTEITLANPAAVTVAGAQVTYTFNSFNSGSATGTNFTWGEVGIITLTPSIGDGNYLGAGEVTGAETGTVGRFIPDHFAVTAGDVTEGCDPGNFTYLGQDGFSSAFTLTAQNKTNATTINYRDALTTAANFAKLSLTVWNNYNFTAPGLPAGSILSASATAPTGSWSNGAASITAKHKASRPAAPAAPVSITVSAQPTDTDGITMASAAAVMAATPLRYGRLVLQNAYGPETEPIKIRLLAQYYNGTSFIPNLADTCSKYTATAPGTDLTCSPLIGPIACADVTATGVDVINGQYFTLTPLLKKTGTLLYTLTATPSWLQYEWDNVAPPDYDENPFARANFGIYRGNDRIINWREIIR